MKGQEHQERTGNSLGTQKTNGCSATCQQPCRWPIVIIRKDSDTGSVSDRDVTQGQIFSLKPPRLENALPWADGVERERFRNRDRFKREHVTQGQSVSPPWADGVQRERFRDRDRFKTENVIQYKGRESHQGPPDRWMPCRWPMV
jgi:hypothetical protein